VQAALARAGSARPATAASFTELREILGHDWSDDRFRAALAVRAYLKTEYEVDREPDRRRMLDVVGRSTAIASDVVGAAADSITAVRRPMFWLARLGRLIAGAAALATQPSMGYLPRIVFRNIAALAFLVGILLVVVGIAGVGGAQKAGWLILAVTAVAQVTVWAATWWVGAPDRRPGRSSSRLWRLLAEAVIAVVVSAVVLTSVVGAAEIVDWISD